MESELVLYPDELLEQAAPPVEDPAEWKDLIERMKGSLRRLEGIGLAAPQVGTSIRIFVMTLDPENDLHEAYLNPEIVSVRGEETVTEGCLSFPDITVEITRGREVDFRALTPGGESVERTVEGLQAQCVQHEVDHLQGKTLLDHCGLQQKLEINDVLQKQSRGTHPDA